MGFKFDQYGRWPWGGSTFCSPMGPHTAVILTLNGLKMFERKH